jgi:CHAT domain-containing protein/tetratricopeptide (TPR) repeat protein
MVPVAGLSRATNAEELASSLIAALAQPDGRTVRVQYLVQTAARSTAPQAVAERLKAEADRQLFILPRLCLPLADAIQRIGTFSEQPSIEALGAMTAADALREQGHYSKALRDYDRASALYESADDEVGWARTRLGAAYTRAATVELGPALEEADVARNILSRRGLWLRLARLESATGNLLRELGRYEESLEAQARAFAAARRIADTHEQDLVVAEVQINCATVYQRLERFELAERLLEGAADTFRRHDRPGPVAIAEGNLARGLAARGHLSRALALASDVRRATLALGRLSHAAIFGQVAVECLLELNRPAEAAGLADDIVAQLTASGAGVELAKTLLQRAIARERLERYAEAARDLGRAERLFRLGGCAGWAPVARLQRAFTLERAGMMETALREARAAHRELSAHNLSVPAARANVLRARLLTRLGDVRSARAAAMSARLVARRRGVPLLQYQACRALGELATDDRDALRAYTAAAYALEQSQGRILAEQRAGFLELDQRLSVYDAAIRLHLKRREPRRAFELAERAKARALVDALALRSRGMPVRAETAATRELADELASLRRRYDRLSSTLFDPRPQDDLAGSAVNGQPAALQRELDICQLRIGAVLDELRLADSHNLDHLPELQGKVHSPVRFLASDTALVQYAVLGNDIVIFVLRRGQPVAARLVSGATGETARLLSVLTLNVRTALTRQASGLEPLARKVLQRLHAVLIAPVENLLEGCRRLVIVPHGVLHRVPFAALHDGIGYLVESLELALAPSASAIRYWRRPHADAAACQPLVISHSADGSLPGAVDEGDRVADLLGAVRLRESEATLDKVREYATRASIVHLAAHGQSLPDAPLLSYVRLADGRLAALDFLDLPLDCDLVTLSACESGQAVVAPGDEPIGLTRSILSAGARSVLQSLWRLDDRITTELMTEFYTQLAGGTGRAAALRAAQVHVLQSDAYAHPAFWASFGLVGDWRPLKWAHA